MVQSKASDDASSSDRRAFIRHPADVPIRVETLPGQPPARVEDISYGGLAFVSDQPRSAGTLINVHIPDDRAGLDAQAVVVWCQREARAYRVGVRFLDPEDAFRSRVIEQIFAIERFRRELAHREGRDVPRDEAAREWVKRHASEFPDP